MSESAALKVIHEKIEARARQLEYHARLECSRTVNSAVFEYFDGSSYPGEWTLMEGAIAVLASSSRRQWWNDSSYRTKCTADFVNDCKSRIEIWQRQVIETRISGEMMNNLLKRR